MKKNILRLCWTAMALVALGTTITNRCDGKPVTFSGRAIVFNLSFPGTEPLVLGDTGVLPEAGGIREAQLDASPVSYLRFQSAAARTSGSNICAVSELTIIQAEVSFSTADGQDHLLSIGNLVMRTSACCFGNGVAFSPILQWSGLTLDATEIPFQVGLNQRLDFQGGHLLINTQRNELEGNAGTTEISGISIVLDRGGGGTIGYVHSDISCPSPNQPPVNPINCDRVKGQGSINVSSLQKTRLGWLKFKRQATFSLSGRRESTGEVGHLVYMDPLAGVQVFSTATKAYSSLGENSRRIAYAVRVNGTPGQAFVVVTDNGTPGAGRDTFSIALSTGYSAQGVLTSGNIKVRHCPPPFL